MAWNISEGELWICFNRDEQRSRPQAEPPSISVNEKGFARIFARDPQGGGTWLAVSQAEFAVALMNSYTGDMPERESPSSRGSIVTVLIDMASSTEAESALAAMTSLRDYGPFYLFILTPDGARQWLWNGSFLSELPECSKFWTTSSHKADAVRLWRTSQWHALTDGAPVSLERASEIMRMRGADPGFGMTMDREDARTVSQTTVILGKGRMQMVYAQRELDGLSFEEPVKSLFLFG